MTYKFDLYFAGAPGGCGDYLREKKANCLYSQQYQRSVINKEVLARYEENKSSGKVMIDSGAYSVFKSGKVLDVDSYIEYLNTNSKCFTYFVQADDMPGEYGRPATLQEKLESPKKSWENYLYMVERVKEPKKLIPVFHNGEDYKWLSNMLEFKDKNNESIDYIALSPMHNVSFKERDKFVEECFKVIENSSNPNVKVHAIGVTRLDLLSRYPFKSADSTSWLMTAITGGIMTDYGTICISSRDSRPDSYMHLPDLLKENLSGYLKSLGYDLTKLSEDVTERCKFNIDYFLRWCENYKYTPSLIEENNLFEFC